MSRATPGRRRVRPGLLILLLLCVGLAGHALWDHVERRRLVAEIERIHARGELVAIPQVEATPASTTLAAAALLVTSVPGELWTVDPMAPETEGLLEAGRHALMLADEAASEPFTPMSGTTDFPYRAAGLSGLSRLVAMRTTRLAARGDGDGAVRSALTGLLVRRAIGSDGLAAAETDVGQVLTLSRPGDAALREWQDALEAAEEPGAVAAAVERSRARYIERVWRVAFGPTSASPRHQTLPWQGVLPWLWRPWFARQIRHDLRAWDEALTTARQPAAVRGPLLLELEARRHTTPPSSPFVRGRWFMRLWPTNAPRVLVDAWRRETLAVDRAARVAIAIERYRRAENDRLPASLDALVPRFIGALPRDPYAGAPLRYLSGPDGYSVYSVGPDLDDDGGAITAPSPQRSADGGMYRPLPADLGVAVTSVIRE